MLFTKQQNATLALAVLILFLGLETVFAGDKENEDKGIKISVFKAHNDFTQSDTFNIKQPIILYILWDIPKDVILRGKAEIKIEGERIDGEKWIIKDKKDLRPNFPSHYWGWDCRHKIPKKAKPGSVGTATVELKIDGHETVKETLTFNIAKNEQK